MNMNKKLLFVLLLVIFLTIPMGITDFTSTGSTTILSDTSIPAAEYDFVNRNEPVSVLVYNEYADIASGGEYDHTMTELKSEYGYTFEYDNLTDYNLLANMINGYDVLLLAEQELATYAQMDAVAAAWTSFLPGWVDAGGVVICMDHVGSVGGSGIHPTARILNITGLMRIYNSTIRSGDTITITNSYDPLAFGVSAYSVSGSSSFDTPDGDAIFSTGGQTVVAHRYLGLGHVVMLGFDLFAVDPNPVVILANAVRLTRLAVFDNSHGATHDPYSGYNNFATEIQQQYGFAIATMNTWDVDLIQSSEVFVAATGGVSPLSYNTSEIALVEAYVTAGGGLLAITDWGYWGNNTDTLLGEFGFARNYTGPILQDIDDHIGDPNQPIYGYENFVNNSMTFNVASIQMFYGNAFISMPTGAVPLVWTDDDGTAKWTTGAFASELPVAATLHYGAGRMIALSDGDFLGDDDYDTDGTIDFFDEDNEVFAIGMMNWLSASGIPEKTILFDNSKAPLAPPVELADFAEFSQFLTLNGFNFMWMNTFDAGLVNQVDILMIPDGSIDYSVTEKNAIVDFVSEGGGLFVLADNTIFNQQVNPVVTEFGLEYNETAPEIHDSDDNIGSVAYIIFDGDNIANHPIMTGVERIELDLNSGFVTVGSGVALLSTDTDGTATWGSGVAAIGVPVFAATTFNMGRVVAVADYNIPLLGDFDGDNYENLYDSDNDVFLANAFYWLMENRAPTVEVTYPNGGEVLTGVANITWTALDLDGDPLTFDVSCSANNGSTWISLATDSSQTWFLWNTALFANGSEYLIRVVVSDGGLTSEDISDDTFTVENVVSTTTTTTSTSTTTTTTNGTGWGESTTTIIIIIIVCGIVIIIIIIIVKKKK